jgi:molybdenum cofactor biosynthesis enzyme MoaA
MKALCSLPFTRLKINEDGSYHSCCFQSSMYGNILEDGIEKAFKNPELRKVKNSMLQGKLDKEYCDNDRCPLRFYDLSRIPHKEVKLTKYPVDLELNMPSTFCNIGGLNPTPETACIMCPRSSEQFMSGVGTDILDDILEEVKIAMPNVQNLSILGIAEPFYKNRIFDVFEKLEFTKYRDNILFWTFCNGTIFTERAQDRFLNIVKNVHLGFSIDAGTAETYIKIRRLDYFNKIKKNLTSYFKKVKEKTEINDRSYTTNNINLYNVYELKEMIDLGIEVGSNSTQFTLTMKYQADLKIDDSKLCNSNNWKIFWEAQKDAEEYAKSKNYNVDFYVPFHNGYLK